MADQLSIQKKLSELEKLRPELLEEALRFIEYLIHREKEKQSLPGISDTNELEFLSEN